jgi:hypothetical protein
MLQHQKGAVRHSLAAADLVVALAAAAAVAAAVEQPRMKQQ